MAYYNPPTPGTPRKRSMPRGGLMPNLPAMGPRPMPEFGAIDPMFGVPSNMPAMPEMSIPVGGLTPTRLVGPRPMQDFAPQAPSSGAPTRMIGTGATRGAGTRFDRFGNKPMNVSSMTNLGPEELRRREMSRQLALETMARFRG